MTTQTTVEAAAARIAELEAELKAARAARPRSAPKPSFKVSAKGAVSVYGMGRFPVTLYKSQWETLIGVIPDLEKFIAANAASLTVKGE